MSYEHDIGVNVKSFGAKADCETDDTQCLLDAARYVLDTPYIGVKNKLIFPSGIYIVTDKFLSDLNNLAGIRRGITFEGVNPYSTILLLKTDSKPSWFYNNGENNHRLERILFRDIGFCTDDSKLGNGFKIWSNGGEKQFQFENCAFGYSVASSIGMNTSMNQLFQFDGLANADLMKFETCNLNSDGDVFTFNNRQSVAIETVATDVVTKGNVIRVLSGGGGSFHAFGGSHEMFESEGETEDKYIVKIEKDAVLGQGNCDFTFTNVRYELHGQHRKLVNTDPFDTNMCQIVWDNCNFGTVDGTPRDVVEINTRKTVIFRSCILHDNFQYSLKGGSDQQLPAQSALIQFDNCDVGSALSVPLYDRIKMDGHGCRAMVKDCRSRGSKSIGEFRTMDFDLGWKNASPRDPSVSLKMVNFKPIWRPFPCNGSNEFTLELPVGTYVKRLYLRKEAKSTSTRSYQLCIGSDDKSIVFGKTEGYMRDVHELEINNFIVNESRIRVWAEGTGDESHTAGLAMIEYY
ncbi:hypothetical protein [Bacillus sp. C1]